MSSTQIMLSFCPFIQVYPVPDPENQHSKGNINMAQVFAPSSLHRQSVHERCKGCQFPRTCTMPESKNAKQQGVVKIARRPKRNGKLNSQIWQREKGAQKKRDPTKGNDATPADSKGRKRWLYIREGISPLVSREALLLTNYKFLN